ncbi:MAG: bifunctional aldolase/short-chain dehydrogenase [Pseudomonadota bacterium]|nr:bifunctional aldolase/short-chain dehydrogenase [Pseudomonadota bacterium]
MFFENLWRDEDVKRMLEKTKKNSIEEDLAYRVYTSRLIGQVADLVMHGGGNTSCKSKTKNLHGETTEVLCVKGSGWDLGSIEAPGLPAVMLEPLLRLRELESLSDEDMVNVQRANLVDSTSPNPSIETLLHAFLPHKFIDHTHSTPFLTIANLPNNERVLFEIFGQKLAVVPYVMPGFDLAKAAARIHDENPHVEGLLLAKHGHFTWGNTAKESYDRVIEHTNMVEKWLQNHRVRRSVKVDRICKDKVITFLSTLRGSLSAVSPSNSSPPVLHLVDDDDVLQFLERDDVVELSTAGVATPDHVIRIKAHPLLLDKNDSGNGRSTLISKLEGFIKDYQKYFELYSTSSKDSKKMLSPLPNLIWAQGIGLIGVGSSAKSAKIITDLAEQNIRVMADCADAGGFKPVEAQDLFNMEYWSLEQAKLGKSKPPVLLGRVVVITGGAGTIGRSIAHKFRLKGAEVILVDKNRSALDTALKDFDRGVLAFTADLTEQNAPQEVVDFAVSKFGGIDVLVSNAGTALQSGIAEMEETLLRDSFELNFFTHFRLARQVHKVFKIQTFGGQILFNVSKQAVNPGKNFGAYGLPKAALFFLVRQLALEFGEDGIRVNGVNADRIRSGMLNDDLIRQRAKARGVDEATYLAGNLLKKEVEAEHVADAFLSLVLSERTTGHIMTVDGGNMEAALR